MNDDEIWEVAGKPVNEYVDNIKQMEKNINKLVSFYLEHTGDQQANEGIEANTSLNQDSQQQKNQTLSPLARAKLEVAIVFSINTCYWMYLVSHGEDPIKNDISKELERVRLFMERAKEVEQQLIRDKSSATKRPKIDKEASKRLCMNNISLKSKWAK